MWCNTNKIDGADGLESCNDQVASSVGRSVCYMTIALLTGRYILACSQLT